MQNLIDRLKTIRASIEINGERSLVGLDKELTAIIEQLETLDQEHARQTDELRTLRETTEGIRASVIYHRRKHNIWQDEISSFDDDVAYLLVDLGNRMTAATDDAAALRGTLEGIRDTARKSENVDSDLTDTHRDIYIRDLLGSVAFRATEGLKEHQSGVSLRKGIRQLEKLVEVFEMGMRQTGGWSYSGDRTLAERVQRCIDHYTRMAAQAVSDSHSFKDSIVSWMRGIAINAQSVSWASTHHEKDARLRGLIEVIETAISNIDEKRFNDRLSSWNGVVDSWMKSDFPTREMRRRILELEDKIKRMNGKEPQAMRVESPVEDEF